MKRLTLVFALMIALGGTLSAQTFSINGFGGYNFQDQVNFGNVYGTVHDGGFWGVSLEGISRQGHAIELLYQQQNTSVPLYYYNTGFPANKDKSNAILSYIMLNGIQYMEGNDHVLPYGGLGIGVGIASPESGSSSSKFAWDLKLGIKFKPSSTVGIKLQAQLFSMVQASGGGFYVGTGGGGVAVSSYSSIYQFGFTGGLTLDFEKGRK